MTSQARIWKAGVLAFLVPCALLSGAVTARAREPIEVNIDLAPGACPLRIDGQSFAWPADEARIAALFAQLKRAGRRPVVIVGDRSTPYRCVSGVIALAQRAHLRFSFVPRPVQVER